MKSTVDDKTGGESLIMSIVGMGDYENMTQRLLFLQVSWLL